MTKKEIAERILLENGKPISLNDFTYDSNTKTISTNLNNLIFNFNNINNFNFFTGSNCTFKTSSYCTFNTKSDCTFKTSSYCTFNTGSDCNFDTSFNCIFKTSSNCTFKTGSNCNFDTGFGCTFKTSSYCTFNTNSFCTFDTSHSCTFTTNDNCVCIRRDIFEIIEIPKDNKTIKLNSFGSKGYSIIDNSNIEIIIKIDGKKININNTFINTLVKEIINKKNYQ